MLRADYEELIEKAFDQIRELTATKGKDYAGDADVVSNFKRNAAALGLTPEQIWAVYAGKHWDAIQSYCREGGVASEPIEGRLLDLMTYCLLMLAMVEERRTEGKVEESADQIRLGQMARTAQRYKDAFGS